MCLNILIYRWINVGRKFLQKLEQIVWLPKHSLNVATGTSQLLRSVFAGFAERFAEKVSSEIISLGERLVSKIDRYYAAFPTLLTVAHRDFRLDNFGRRTRVVCADRHNR